MDNMQNFSSVVNFEYYNREVPCELLVRMCVYAHVEILK